ncbi:MAG: hypothetical protein AABZ30_08530 [Myxococcota bacterium]
MKLCGACKTQNIDDANLCVGCSAPLTELAAEAEVSRMMQAQAARTKRNRMLGIGAGLLVIAGAVALIRQSSRSAAEREAVRAFGEKFSETYGSTVPEFWKCVMSGGRAPATNLDLAQGIDAAFRKSPKGYLKLLRNKCLPIALGAPPKLRALVVPESVRGNLEAYATTLQTVSKTASDFAARIAGMTEQAEKDAKVVSLASNYHYAEQDGPDTWAYDHFLRCAIPGIDDMTELQPALVFLFEVKKSPEGHVARWRKECQPALADTATAKPHARYQSNTAKFSSDNRDVQAFTEVFQKADDAARQKLTEPLERAWVHSAQAWEDLKAAIKDVLGDANG